MKLEDINLKLKNNYLNMYEATYTKDDKTKIYEIVSRNKDLNINNFGLRRANAVISILFNENYTKILLLKEFRLACNNYVYNFPGGLIDKNDKTLADTAVRELKEETGLDLYNVIEELPIAYDAAAFSDEAVYTIVGQAKGEIRESDCWEEEIEAVWVSKKDAVRLLKENVYMSVRVQSLLWMWVNSERLFK